MRFLDRVAEKVHGPRQQDYGPPSENHAATAAFWRTYVLRRYGVSVDFDVAAVCAMNRLQKESRLAETPDHEDSLEDIAGYAENQARDIELREGLDG